MSYLDNIKLLASELASMSPRTQLEIVKLCKNLCIEVKDFLVDFSENDFEEALSRITAIEGRLDSDEDDIALHTQEIGSINSSIDNIIIDLNNRYTKSQIDAMLESYYTKSQIDALLNYKADKSTTYTKTEADALLNNKLDNPSITLFGSGGTLTTEQLNTVKDAKTIIINIEGDLYYKRQYNSSNDIIFTQIRVYDNTKTDTAFTPNREYMELYLKSAYINKNTGVWVIDNSYEHADNKFVTVYNKAEIDALLAGNFNLSQIVDDDGNRRFVEGNITFETISDIVFDFGKWSLSGTHLMIVIAGHNTQATTISHDTTICNITLPDYILDKIATIYNPVVSWAGTKFYKSSTGTDAGTMNTRLVKSTNTVGVGTNGNTTLTEVGYFRLQFDLLIDAD